MSHSYTNLLTHVIFSTKDREPLITAALRDDLLAYLGGIVRELGGALRAANARPEHVHLLCSLPPTVAMADALRVVKTNSSRWVHRSRNYSWLRMASRLWSVQRQPFPGASRGALYWRPGEASPPRDLPGGVDRLPPEEWHRLRRALYLVVISFAPFGARNGVGGAILPRLAPWATIFRPLCGLAENAINKGLGRGGWGRFSHGLRRGLRSFARRLTG